MTSAYDLIIRGGSVVTPDRVAKGDVGIARGKFVTLAPSVPEPARQEIDATGLHVFPGILDAHVHFGEPGRAEWEGLAAGPEALAAGGGTWFADMPMVSTPPVLDLAAFNAKRRLAEQKAVTDFSLWGGLTPGNLSKLAELRDAGVIGVKASLCATGFHEFPALTDPALLRLALKRASELGLLVAVHAEEESTTDRLMKAAKSRGATDARSWLATRPVEAELAAIRLATELAGETRCALHVTHVSSPQGLALVNDARRRGANVSAETCPHYLLLNEDEAVRLGPSAKCVPPLRPELLRQGMWRSLSLGFVDTISSNHTPAPAALKATADFFAAAEGITGVQHGFPLLLGTAIAGLKEQWALLLMAALLSANVAHRFRLPAKGRIQPGNDADFVLLDLRREEALSNQRLLNRHRHGPYEGRRCNVRVAGTYIRGRCIWNGQTIAPAAPRGIMLKPGA